MAKKDDTQLDDWRYRYPSAGVSWNLTGDPAYCQRFMGEAKIFLYQLKNRMNIAVPKLTSLRDGPRLYNGGTTITVASIFGQDFIDIDVSRGLGGRGKCTITFIDFPLYVPPMRNPGEIRTGEVQGVDYFKTYYSIDVSKCPTCQVTSWEFLFTYLQSSPLVPPTVPISKRKEWPIEPLHHHDFDADGLLLDHDGTDHTIYSMSPPAWGEVISHGTDGGGTYVIWKAYTETEVISRTGLAIMRLVARIKDNTGVEICAQNERIEVDCCLKDIDLRKVEIWWENSLLNDGQMIFFGDRTLYRMPKTGINSSVMFLYAVSHGSFYALPEFLNGCIPFSWTFVGPGKFTEVGEYKDKGGYERPDVIDCATTMALSLEDRCATEYKVNIHGCCGTVPALEIFYASLQMQCGEPQSFYVEGGCPPYIWTCTSGLFSNGETTGYGASVGYNAPNSNAGCTNNPTITVTDCCGESTAIQIAVNCYEIGVPAFYIPEYIYGHATATDACMIGGVWHCMCDFALIYHYFTCSGAFYSTVPQYTRLRDQGVMSGSCTSPPVPCATSLSAPFDFYTAGTCIPGAATEQGGVPTDLRISTWIEGGCCPLNPYSGLPF